MGRDVVPVLNGKTKYADWKKRVEWWQQAANVKAGARAATLIVHMSGTPDECALQLDVAQLSVATGMTLLLKELDKLYSTRRTRHSPFA